MKFAAHHVLTAFLACGTFVIAQEKDTPAQRFAAQRAKVADEVREQLQSDDLATIAWAAHTHAEMRLDGCVPELRAKLASIAEKKGDERDFAALAILDALIQADKDVPGEEVAPFLGSLTRCSAFTLLRRQPRKNLSQLIALHREAPQSGALWLECGKLIADSVGKRKEARAEFALALLRAPILLFVEVHDAGATPIELGDYGVQVSGCVKLKAPDGFPPIVQYGSGGPNARATSPWLSDAWSSFNDRMLGARNRWMAQLLDLTKDTFPHDLSPFVHVAWSGLASLEAAEAVHRAKIVATHRAVAAMCVEARLVSAEVAASLVPEIRRLRLDDRTDHFSAPLSDSL